MPPAPAVRKKPAKVPPALTPVQLLAARAAVVSVANAIDSRREALRAELAQLDAEHDRASGILRHIDGRMKDDGK